MKPTVPLLLAILGSISLVLLSGCGDGNEEIRIYKISHPEGFDPHAGHTHSDLAPAAPMAPAAPAPMPSSAGQPSVNPSSSMATLPGMESAAQAIDTPEWTVPASWEELPPTSIRKGNFRIVEGEHTVEITVTAFPGDVGGLEANINRWRRQIGLEPLPLASLQPSIESIEVDGQPAYAIDLINAENPGGLGILGAVIPHGPQTWFVKMVGSPAILANQENTMKLFLDSIQF